MWKPTFTEFVDYQNALAESGAFEDGPADLTDRVALVSEAYAEMEADAGARRDYIAEAYGPVAQDARGALADDLADGSFLTLTDAEQRELHARVNHHVAVRLHDPTLESDRCPGCRNGCDECVPF